MTIIRDYLKTDPVSDVQSLLDKYNCDNYPCGCDKTCENVVWSIEQDKAWTKVILGDGKTRLVCYYRPGADGDEYAVSDRGETVSQIMRLTGLSWRDSLKYLHRVECLCELDYDRDADIVMDPDVDGLAQAIVTTMQIAASCLKGL